MKTIDIKQGTEEWLNLRKSKITGSKLKDLVVKRGTGEKIGFYQLIADRLAITDESESPMDRGHSCEPEAIKAFEELTGKKVTTAGMWVSDENENIACSPDGVIGDKEAVEIKCLSASRHLEAWFTKEIPSEYEYQALQYFIVNEKLQKLYFCFYDSRVIAKPFFYIEVLRDVEKVEELKKYQLEKLAKVEEFINSLITF